MAVESSALLKVPRALTLRYMAALSFFAFYRPCSLSSRLQGVFFFLVLFGFSVGCNSITPKWFREPDRKTAVEVELPDTWMTLNSLRLHFGVVTIVISLALFSSLALVWMGSPILVSGIRELDPETLAWFICGLLTFELVLASVLDLVPLFKTYRKLRDVVLTRKRQGSEGITGEKEE